MRNGHESVTSYRFVYGTNRRQSKETNKGACQSGHMALLLMTLTMTNFISVHDLHRVLDPYSVSMIVNIPNTSAHATIQHMSKCAGITKKHFVSICVMENTAMVLYLPSIYSSCIRALLFSSNYACHITKQGHKIKATAQGCHSGLCLKRVQDISLRVTWTWSSLEHRADIPA